MNPKTSSSNDADSTALWILRFHRTQEAHDSASPPVPFPSGPNDDEELRYRRYLQNRCKEQIDGKCQRLQDLIDQQIDLITRFRAYRKPDTIAYQMPRPWPSFPWFPEEVVASLGSELLSCLDIAIELAQRENDLIAMHLRWFDDAEQVLMFKKTVAQAVFHAYEFRARETIQAEADHSISLLAKTHVTSHVELVTAAPRIWRSRCLWFHLYGIGCSKQKIVQALMECLLPACGVRIQPRVVTSKGASEEQVDVPLPVGERELCLIPAQILICAALGSSSGGSSWMLDDIEERVESLDSQPAAARTLQALRKEAQLLRSAPPSVTPDEAFERIVSSRLVDLVVGVATASVLRDVTGLLTLGNNSDGPPDVNQTALKRNYLSSLAEDVNNFCRGLVGSLRSFMGFSWCDSCREVHRVVDAPSISVIAQFAQILSPTPSVPSDQQGPNGPCPSCGSKSMSVWRTPVIWPYTLQTRLLESLHEVIIELYKDLSAGVDKNIQLALVDARHFSPQTLGVPLKFIPTVASPSPSPAEFDVSNGSNVTTTPQSFTGAIRTLSSVVRCRTPLAVLHTLGRTKAEVERAVAVALRYRPQQLSPQLPTPTADAADGIARADSDMSAPKPPPPLESCLSNSELEATIESITNNLSPSIPPIPPPPLLMTVGGSVCSQLDDVELLFEGSSSLSPEESDDGEVVPTDSCCTEEEDSAPTASDNDTSTQHLQGSASIASVDIETCIPPTTSVVAVTAPSVADHVVSPTVVLGADDLMPIYDYIFIQAQVPHITAIGSFVEDFSPPQEMASQYDYLRLVFLHALPNHALELPSAVVDTDGVLMTPETMARRITSYALQRKLDISWLEPAMRAIGERDLRVLKTQFQPTGSRIARSQPANVVGSSAAGAAKPSRSTSEVTLKTPAAVPEFAINGPSMLSGPRCPFFQPFSSFVSVTSDTKDKDHDGQEQERNPFSVGEDEAESFVAESEEDFGSDGAPNDVDGGGNVRGDVVIFSSAPEFAAAQELLVTCAVGLELIELCDSSDEDDTDELHPASSCPKHAKTSPEDVELLPLCCHAGADLRPFRLYARLVIATGCSFPTIFHLTVSRTLSGKSRSS